MANSNKSAWQLSQDYTNMVVAGWTRTFFAHRSWVAAALATMGALAFLSVVPLHHWHTLRLYLLLGSACVALLNACLRIVIGERLPRWTLHLDVTSGNVFVTVAAAAAGTEHINLANLYLLVAFFAFLYLPLRAAVIHLAVAGAAYGIVLAAGTRPEEPATISWLSVFGTAAVLGAVVVGLISVLRMAAREDPLTGLANRRLWNERLEEEIERAKRSNSELSVLVIDLDGFKLVNDTGGHDAGDRLLRTVASSFQTVIRNGGDFLARLGGDEFGVLAPGLGEIGVRGLANRLTQTLPEGLSASIGIASWDRSESTANLVRRADQAMYQKKQQRGKEHRPA